MTLQGYRVHALVDPARKFVETLPEQIELFYNTLAQHEPDLTSLISECGFDTGISVLIDGRLPSRISFNQQSRIKTLLNATKPLIATLEYLQYGTKRISKEPIASVLRGQSDALKAALTAFIDDLCMTLWKESAFTPETSAAFELFQKKLHQNFLRISIIVTATERLSL